MQQTKTASLNKRAAMYTLTQAIATAKQILSEKNNTSLCAGENFVSIKFATENGGVINLSIKEGAAL